MGQFRYMHEFTVKRSKWLRGNRDPQLNNNDELAESVLLNERGSMCCVGFFVKSCGAANKTIRGKGALSSLMGYSRERKRPAPPSVLKALALFGVKPDNSSDPCSSAYIMNDAPSGSIASKNREAKIKEFFKKYRIKVNFVD